MSAQGNGGGAGETDGSKDEPDPTATGGGGRADPPDDEVSGTLRTTIAANEGLDDTENEENLHERMHRQRHSANFPHQHHHHHGPSHHHHHDKGHVKELIKPDRSTIRPTARSTSTKAKSPPPATTPTGNHKPAQARVATAVGEEQLHQRFVDSITERRKIEGSARDRKAQSLRTGSTSYSSSLSRARSPTRAAAAADTVTNSTSSSSSGKSHSSHDSDDKRSPPPAAIIIPPEVAKSLSKRSRLAPNAASQSSGRSSSLSAQSETSGPITKEQLEYGPLLKKDEVQVLYRSPVADSNYMDRHLKEEQAKLVAPSTRQSPISIMTNNPTYELQNKPLIIEYPATLENLCLSNTGFSWEVKIPYQISMTTALYGAHLNTSHRYRLDQFHCHWGPTDDQGSEHTVDNKCYSAEMHFVHYNMEKYHTMSKASRHPDGLVVVGVFLDAQPDHHDHAELEKIVSRLKLVSLKGERAIMKQATRIENLLPADKSYWSYQGSLTTPPYFESVTWFVLKHPVKCSVAQIQKFRNLRSSLRQDDDDDDELARIRSNHRKTQPLNGRTIVNYDEALRSSQFKH